MLLRSITKHVKDQNWFAVALDFFIVVAGILIAFQITNWNEGRGEASRERVLLERLHGDFVQIIAFGNTVVPGSEAQPAATSGIIRAIRTDTPPEDTVHFHGLINISNQVFAPMPPSATFNELVSTGELSRISNQAIRIIISDYEFGRSGDLNLLDKHLDNRDNRAISSAIRFSTHDTDYRESMVSVSYDWERLKDAEPDLQIMLRTQLLRLAWQRRALTAAENALDLIEAELGLPPSKKINPEGT